MAANFCVKMKRPRLKDIAEALQISIATVSRALKNHPDISDQLKLRVRQLADDLNYEPNNMALQFKAQRSKCIAVVSPRIVHYYFSTILKGILQEAEKQGYQVAVCETGHELIREVKHIKALTQGLNDGLLICVGNNTTDIRHLEKLQKQGIPFVLFDKDVSRIKAPKVVVDDYTGAMTAVEHLIAQGYRHIAHLQDNGVAHTSQKRLKGYLSALKKHRIPYDESLVLQLNDISIAAGYEAVEQMIRSGKKMDAVFAITDELAIGAMKAAMAHGMAVPQDFGVVGFSNWQIATLVTPSLSTVAQPGIELGQTATKMLIQMIENEQSAEEYHLTRILKTQLIVRDSSFRKRVVVNT